MGYGFPLKETKMARLVTKDFEIMPIQVNRAMANHDMRKMPFVENHAALTQYFDAMLDTMIIELKSYVMAKKHTGKTTRSMSISMPSTAWQHVKHQYAPEWFLKRYPVLLKTERMTIPVNHSWYMCPHADVKWSGEGNTLHMAFMCKPGYDEYGEKLD